MLFKVFKLDKNLNIQLTLGEKLVPGADDQHFCMPTDVAVSRIGYVFVSDGYCNSRVMKFNERGDFIMAFGRSNGLAYITQVFLLA